MLRVPLGLSIWLTMFSAVFAAGEDTLFEKEIRPVLVEACQKCHGPRKQEGDLRLDSRQALLKGGASGPAVIPGNPSKGTLLAAVSHAGEVKMPPSGKLPAAAIAAMTKWVAAGAPWPAESTGASSARTAAIMPADRNHWSFRPVTKPSVPGTIDRAWPRSPIDSFLLARMERAGARPAPLADKRTLIRRASFDLTGLPPTPDEIDAFLKDESSGAFARLVDRLLASPRYGERWGRHWLDVARYADTAGDGSDYPLPEAWRYRNWVINAFNADMPFDRFVREQIAGDILAVRGKPGEYADAVTATGYLAIGKRYGYNPGPAFQHLDFADVIDSVGRGLMGLSLGCARCHDHKYEPVGMEDYYGLYGILQSTVWAFPGGEEHKKPANMVPLVPPSEVERARKEMESAAAADSAALRSLVARRAALSGKSWLGGEGLDFEGQALAKPPATPWLSLGPNSITSEAQSPFVHVHPTGARGVRMAAGKPNDGIRFVFPEPIRVAKGTPVDITCDMRVVAPAAGSFRLYFGRGVIASTATDISVSAGEIAIRDGASWKVVAKTPPLGTWFTIRLTIDPDRGACGGQLHTEKGPFGEFSGLKLFPGWDGVLDTIICDGIGHVPGPCPTRDLDNFGVSDSRLPAPGAAVAKVVSPSPEAAAELSALESQIRKIKERVARPSPVPAYPVAYAVSEGKPIDAAIQKRGEPDKAGPVVPRRFLGILGGQALPANHVGSGRLELANWIADRGNPLTARVFANRVWQWHFGRGLVETPDDFGLRGERPSHPELLDWLSEVFVESGWSVKALHRAIMNSAAYQVSAGEVPESLRADPLNKLFWRRERRALDAESLRDSMLAAAGNLDLNVPGGHPFPPVEKWSYTIHNPFYADYESRHRSVYLMSQRNRRNAYLSLFDAADPNLASGTRVATITPSQALFLMNSPFAHEQAGGLARRLVAGAQDDRARYRLGVAITQGRDPSGAETEEAMAFIGRYRAAAPEVTAAQAWEAMARTLLASNPALHLD